MNHVLIGAALPLVAFAAMYVVAGRRASLRLLIGGPFVAGLSGAWAVVPDMPRLWGNRLLYTEWHHRWWCDMCWAHCWIDDGEVDRPWYPLAFVAVGVLLIAVAWRELVCAERDGADRDR